MIDRYDLLTGGHHGGQMVASDNGDYVDFADYADLAARLAEAELELARWGKLRPLAMQISDPTLRGIVVSFLDRFAYGQSKFDMQADINQAQRPTASADPLQEAALRWHRNTTDQVQPHAHEFDVDGVCEVCGFYDAVNDLRPAATVSAVEKP